MLSITLAALKTDITSLLKGTGLREITDFYGTAASAANRMLARIDTEETRRTATLATPFWDDVQDYALATDYKGMIDIRPQANRQDMPGLSHFGQTTARQFNEKLDADSFSIRWNNMVRTLRAQRLPAGNVITMDTFDSPTGNGAWTVGGDASSIGTQSLNYVQGNAAVSFNLSGVTGAANIVNTTAPVTDMTAYAYLDASMMFIYIPTGKSALFTSFKLRRGSSATAYKEVTVTTKADGTAFTDGWNFLLFEWSDATTTGSPDDTLNTYRYFGIAMTTGTSVTGFLVDSWTDSLGTLYEMEYYSECLFRNTSGTWLYTATDDTDLLNVSPASYEIFKAEMMSDITRQIRTGATRKEELEELRILLNGDPRAKDKDLGLYENYLRKFPSSRIVTVTSTYDWDV